jgi:GST-like protein
MTQDRWTLHGAAGWGSVISEAMLAFCGAPFDVVDVTGFDSPGPARDRLLALNPAAQVPTLVTPGGEVMTESAAIALLLSELYPDAGLCPAPGSPERARFLRWLVWIVAQVYPTFALTDYPGRWAPEAEAAFAARALAHRQDLWRLFEAAVRPGPWSLGETFSALDIYLAVMVRWRPGVDWFADHCPLVLATARRVQGIDSIAPVLERNFGAPY